MTDTSNDRSGSAKIYMFPPRGRFAAIGQIDEAKSTPSFVSPRAVRIASGSSWYHEAAIQAEENGKG